MPCPGCAGQPRIACAAQDTAYPERAQFAQIGSGDVVVRPELEADDAVDGFTAIY